MFKMGINQQLYILLRLTATIMDIFAGRLEKYLDSSLESESLYTIS